MAFDDEIARTHPVCLLRHVGLDIARRLPEPAHCLAGQCAVGRVEVRQHHFRALGQEAFDAGEADAAQTARNKRDTPLQSL